MALRKKRQSPVAVGRKEGAKRTGTYSIPGPRETKIVLPRGAPKAFSEAKTRLSYYATSTFSRRGKQYVEYQAPIYSRPGQRLPGPRFHQAFYDVKAKKIIYKLPA